MKAMERLTSPLRSPVGACLGWLLCGAMCLAQAPAPAPNAATKVIVADVIPDGNHLVPTQKIMSIIKTRPGAEYDQEKVNEDVRALYQTHSFANIQVQRRPTSDGKVIVYFLFAEFASTVQEIVYNGAKHIKPDELEKITGLRKGMPLNPVSNQLARTAILKHYHDKGRMFAGVDLVEGDKTGDTRVVFNITEGPVVKVSGFEIQGCTFVHPARLKTQLSESRAFLGLIGGDYNPMGADADVAKLEEYYRTFGFHDVRVSRELKWADDQRSVKIIFHIHEGQRYRVGSVDVANNQSEDRERLLSLARLHTGDYYNKSVVKVDETLIQAVYGYNGCDAKVEEQQTFKDGTVDVTYQIKEQQPSRVGQIRIVGNEVTRQNVILRQVPLYPGQLLTYPDVKIAERNLARLNIFEVNGDGVKPTVLVLDNGDPDNPYKDVEIRVQETHTGSLLFGVGVNSDAGLTGSIVLNERNFDILRPPTSFEDFLSGRAFRGAGQEFRIEAVPGTQLQRYTVSWREPFLFDSPWSLGVSGYFYQRQYNEYNEDRLGMRVSLGRKLNDCWSVAGALRIENVNVSNVAFYAPETFQEVVGNNFLLGLRGSITRDTRDSYLRPTEGSLIELGYEQCFGSYTFPLVSLEANKYFTIFQRADGSGRHVLAARSQVAYAGSDTPVYERYYAGGFRSMRGFEFRGVGPDYGGFKVGGDFMFLNSLEYQIPILANDSLYAVTFIDSGTVESKVDLQNYRVAAGFGLRVVVPMLGPVPIALDFGFPIVKASFDNTQVFSFWVGFFH